ncbi:alpha/beta hydrolase family protein [Leucobacter komagatae]|uniref:Alpha/beta hydrolase family protein n=1 Tax=Leucobacter komagatae TaxID=55969 RepID=A0A542Y9S7_9MICO|nr:alpha/beta fold hydrolase [Leucobacter komagatae]TQL44825.1 alpha/beta hydrolase family protein [Leucobacter komagatae]
MTHRNTAPTLILVAGHWLGSWAWADVILNLPTERVRALPLTLPGLDPTDPDRATRDLDDQAAAILDHISGAGGSAESPVFIAAHSGANAPVTLVLDRAPELVAGVVWVDSGPIGHDSAFAPDLPAEVAELPLPPVEELTQQASLDGLSAEALDRFRARAVPQPGPAVRQRARLTNPARRAVPATFVCCSISGDQIRELAAAGHPMFAEVAELKHPTFVDLPTGHWPMWSRPRELAAAIEQTVRGKSH